MYKYFIYTECIHIHILYIYACEVYVQGQKYICYTSTYTVYSIYIYILYILYVFLYNIYI